MIYIVAGFPRSGTSMMMRALEAGGITAARDKEAEEAFQKRIDESENPGDKDLNPHGYYELTEKVWDNPTHPRMYNDMAVKVLAPWVYIPRLAVHEYRIIIMRRDPQEIALSIATANGGALLEGDHWRLSNYQAHLREGYLHAINRKDVESVAIVDYAEILQNPEKSFGKLEEQGWPIDVEKAASVIDTSLYRKKYTDLDDVKEQFAQLLHKNHNVPIEKARESIYGAKTTASIDGIVTAT